VFRKEYTFIFMISLIQTVGIAASACTATSLLPQLIKIAREKKADDLSMPMLGILFAGVALWIVYGILKTDLIIIIANAVSLVLNVVIVILSLKYKKDE
jgi:MtN3 and saliva related transmembrane protein